MASIQIQSILFIIIVHFLADFALQTPDQAVNKSKSWLYLLYHVLTYSGVWVIAMWAHTGSFEAAFVFGSITLGIHYITDFTTSRISKPFFEKKDYHNGFVVVGFDQVLHYIQLMITYNFILQYLQ